MAKGSAFIADGPSSGELVDSDQTWASTRDGDELRDTIMRTFLTVVALTSLTVPALAQGMSMGKGMGGRHGTAAEAESKKPKVDEGAYRAALGKIPDKKQPTDPWGAVRTPAPK